MFVGLFVCFQIGLIRLLSIPVESVGLNDHKDLLQDKWFYGSSWICKILHGLDSTEKPHLNKTYLRHKFCILHVTYAREKLWAQGITVRYFISNLCNLMCLHAIYSLLVSFIPEDILKTKKVRGIFCMANLSWKKFPDHINVSIWCSGCRTLRKQCGANQLQPWRHQADAE